MAAGLAAVAAPSANALPFINAGISFSDGGITVPAAPSTSIVSGLNFITQGSPAVNSCSGDLSNCGTPTSGGSFFVTTPSGSVIYTETDSVTGDVFTFTLASITGVNPTTLHSTGANLLGDALSFNIQGAVTDSLNAFQPTAFGGTWSAQGACVSSDNVQCTSNITASYSASLTVLGTQAPPTVPEPASLSLLGVGLAGIGMMARRRRAK